ncbi:UDP-N-acetylglucosamine 2-epimerase (non-hydrolyzing) [Candidatus Brocadia sapporoensis]|uniref:UDP-N-acetylglucosamine 2-epimerase (Non-hydrolyzing) n=1 Tax=Candidatus Brocadia sapporoensis TaxID=392547 RepID=A0A1V6M1K9_9BACT|nr:UDP-N-acetylglucosamine 2-epimerase (non-hydrolyzing) [Candidatus Brocadia sapporoensis]MDG6006484.1 UDP-N-acetylglucosamine 2-epimerase (non-hydrolyzing) [Candidatus Brocadia sp.]OQD46206.1 UDP-N-acetylglucosamine 2-epimerase (non-hydrolyzing) [Candidatus Brocadia sapporoensis]GJQ23499.1 MAG: UDP-2,3-diacetamido-2,3-dideoxy-D-glucuronate 2-epimerase [Candidatus Brocadia sapporoensis]
MKIITIVGARPQFIKAAAVSREISKRPEINEIIIHTGQHFDKNMSDVFFEEMQIPTPRYRLNINSLNHGAMTGRMLEGIEPVLLKEKPDYVLVYGDTNTTLAGALAAKKLHIRVVHIEAGLRSYNMKMPEEINRILTDRISDILCCPTDKAIENLKREGFEHLPCQVVMTGDVMQDAAWYYREVSANKSNIMNELGLAGEDFLLCTIHRAENTDDVGRLTNIVNALNEIALELEVILPLHPRTKKIINSMNINHRTENLKLIDPVSYFDMIELLKYTRMVLTDSGGVQKEAFFFAKPCITLRDETEWVELVDKGFNRLAGAEKEKILNVYHEMKDEKIDFHVDLYGNGQAGKNIINTIKNHH